MLPIKTIANNALIIVGFILKNISFLKKRLRPPKTTRIIVLTNIIVETFLSLKYKAAREISVATITAAILRYKSLSDL